ncbi:MAG TPA: radical SAM family heme chaperone HemW [Hyphomonadaceae bacterium]|nr:radical SAM family heme chaperone HemW [Hyphomonadaceae bacterium]
MNEFDPARGFGVYIHWPYCTRICPYCDFNVYAAKSRDNAPLADAIAADLKGWRDRTGPRKVDTVYFGGGTPSLIRTADLERMLRLIDDLWGYSGQRDFTLEVHPEDGHRFKDFRAFGISRLSIGVQSFDDYRLRFLGRAHTAKQARAAIEAARAEFASVSIDLIYATPGQARDQWRAELAEAISRAPHLSLYELTIEPGAAFARSVARRDFAPMEDDAAADLYEMTEEMTDASRFRGYEISNYAFGSEFESRHNRIYWESGDWVGAGPGAHGRITANGARLAIEAEPDVAAYMRKVNSSGVGWRGWEALAPLAQARERVAMGLRVAEGFPVADIGSLGFSLDTGKLQRLEALGLVIAADGRVALTRKGRLVADRIAAELSP